MLYNFWSYTPSKLRSQTCPNFPASPLCHPLKMYLSVHINSRHSVNLKQQFLAVRLSSPTFSLQTALVFEVFSYAVPHDSHRGLRGEMLTRTRMGSQPPSPWHSGGNTLFFPESSTILSSKEQRGAPAPSPNPNARCDVVDDEMVSVAKG